MTVAFDQATESLSHEVLLRHKLNLIGQAARLTRTSFNHISETTEQEGEAKLSDPHFFTKEHGHAIIDRLSGLEQVVRELRDSVYISDPPCIFRPKCHEIAVTAALRVKYPSLFALNDRNVILPSVSNFDKLGTRLAKYEKRSRDLQLLLTSGQTSSPNSIPPATSAMWRSSLEAIAGDVFKDYVLSVMTATTVELEHCSNLSTIKLELLVDEVSKRDFTSVGYASGSASIRVENNLDFKGNLIKAVNKAQLLNMITALKNSISSSGSQGEFRVSSANSLSMGTKCLDISSLMTTDNELPPDPSTVGGEDVAATATFVVVTQSIKDECLFRVVEFTKAEACSPCPNVRVGFIWRSPLTCTSSITFTGEPVPPSGPLPLGEGLGAMATAIHQLFGPYFDGTTSVYDVKEHRLTVSGGGEVFKILSSTFHLEYEHTTSTTVINKLSFKVTQGNPFLTHHLFPEGRGFHVSGSRAVLTLDEGGGGLVHLTVPAYNDVVWLHKFSDICSAVIGFGDGDQTQGTLKLLMEEDGYLSVAHNHHTNPTHHLKYFIGLSGSRKVDFSCKISGVSLQHQLSTFVLVNSPHFPLETLIIICLNWVHFMVLVAEGVVEPMEAKGRELGLKTTLGTSGVQVLVELLPNDNGDSLLVFAFQGGKALGALKLTEDHGLKYSLTTRGGKKKLTVSLNPEDLVDRWYRPLGEMWKEMVISCN